MTARASQDGSIKAVLQYFRGYWSRIGAITALSVLAALLEAGGLILTVALTDSLSTGSQTFSRSVGPLTVEMSRKTLIVGALAAILASTLVTLAANRIRSRVTVGWTRARRSALVENFLDADWGVQSGERAGRLQAVAAFIDQSAGVLSNIITAGRGLAGVCVLLVTAVVVSPIAAIAILVLGGLLFAGLRPLTMTVRGHGREHAELSRRFNEDLGELSEMASDVRVFGVSGRFQRRAGSSIDELARSEERLYRLSWSVTPIYQSLALALIVVVLAVASRSESVDLSSLGAVALLVLRSVAYGQQLQTSYHGLQAGAPNLELMGEALSTFADSRSTYGSLDAERIDVVTIDDVAFSYDDAAVALEGITLELHRGEIVGLVGPSGAGKTTLAHLLLGLWTPDRGVMRADGRAFQEYSRHFWTRTVSLVPQEPHLIHGTVLDNIAFFRDEVTRDDVVSAATAAGIHDTIRALEHGYETLIGRTTRNLSGGQIQRIGIARALAGHPSVLILDEPTSALDQHSEALVQQTLEGLRGTVLVVIIAHRLTTLSVCDRIVVLNNGTIEAMGTVDDAAAQSEFFRNALRQVAESQRQEPKEATGYRSAASS